MAEQLQVLDVRIGAPRESSFTATQQRLDIAIDLRNTSKSSLHIISSVRSLDYDPATRTLFVGLCEPPGQTDVTPHQFVMPHTSVIQPKQAATIKVSVPQVIRKVVPANQLGLAVEELDVAGVEHVRVEVAYSRTPFYPKPSEPAARLFQELRSWGSRVTTTMPRTTTKGTQEGER